jgi:TRAP-type C4-dicarboxylate transport system permease small subunit
MSVLLSLFFTWLIREIIRAALSPKPRLQMWWPLGMLLAGTAFLTLYYLRRINSTTSTIDSPSSAPTQ